MAWRDGLNCIPIILVHYFLTQVYGMFLLVAVFKNRLICTLCDLLVMLHWWGGGGGEGGEKERFFILL